NTSAARCADLPRAPLAAAGPRSNRSSARARSAAARPGRARARPRRRRAGELPSPAPTQATRTARPRARRVRCASLARLLDPQETIRCDVLEHLLAARGPAHAEALHAFRRTETEMR